ncbi:hypothetical protein [Vulcanisaeta souniana]|uniref:hypothetical protein n=1 Tax=Vulcanisaeta souniana TaxID=164452 RepID=UPI001FB35219|nr:hypothetical protein [Vulcanisaeta souniana]
MNSVNLTAIYNPPLGGNYLPSEATVQINVAFNTTSLTANYTNHVMWGGEPINVSGYVSGPPIRQVIISIDGGVNVSTYTVNNEFSTTISTGNMTPPGNYSITIYAPPVGPYSPAYMVGSVSVSSVVENVTIITNYLAIAGLPITLRGALWVPVGNLSLSLSVGGETVRLDLNGPNFTVSIPTSPLLSMGRHYIIVSVSPSPPVMGAVYTYDVFVVNIPEVVIPMAIAWCYSWR